MLTHSTTHGRSLHRHVHIIHIWVPVSGVVHRHFLLLHHVRRHLTIRHAGRCGVGLKLGAYGGLTGQCWLIGQDRARRQRVQRARHDVRRRNVSKVAELTVGCLRLLWRHVWRAHARMHHLRRHLTRSHVCAHLNRARQWWLWRWRVVWQRRLLLLLLLLLTQHLFVLTQDSSIGALHFGEQVLALVSQLVQAFV